MAFRKTCSSKLIEGADDFIDLSASQRFLISKGKPLNQKINKK
jgi:hypothetical protein